MNNSPIYILGAGPAGLSLAFYLHKKNIDFRVIEAGESYGGNATTFEFSGHKYDSGAHRVHDKIDHITEDIKQLVGSDLSLITAPSQIYSNDQFIDFPLTPKNLYKKLGFKEFSKASLNVLKSKLTKSKADNFYDMVVGAYGENMSNRFLIPYSQKLWGLNAKELSCDISGGRLKGLNLGAFFIDSILGKKSKHLDGSFYYPKNGIGQVFDCIVDEIGMDKILFNSRVTKLNVNNEQLVSIEVNNKELIPCEQVYSSLPINVLINAISPQLDQSILELGRQTNYRDVLLISFRISKPSVTKNASIYFPDSKFKFTRLVEPKNRSLTMSPNGETLLVIEVPFTRNIDVEQYVDDCKKQLLTTGLVSEKEIIESEFKVLPKAYPILKVGYSEVVEKMNNSLKSLSNLSLIGRNGHFAYSHIHDLFAESKDIVSKLNERAQF